MFRAIISTEMCWADCNYQ